MGKNTWLRFGKLCFFSKFTTLLRLGLFGCCCCLCDNCGFDDSFIHPDLLPETLHSSFPPNTIAIALTGLCYFLINMFLQLFFFKKDNLVPCPIMHLSSIFYQTPTIFGVPAFKSNTHSLLYNLPVKNVKFQSEDKPNDITVTLPGLFSP